MKSKRTRMLNGIIVLMLLALSGYTCGCRSNSYKLPAISVSMEIDPSQVIGELEERYIGFSFDTAQITGAKWWSTEDGNTPATMPDLENAKLRRLASYLAPSMLRIGGTDCDGYYFCPVEGDCQLPSAFQGVWRNPDDRQPATMTREKIRRIADFAEAIGAQIMFCINAGPGPRDPKTGAWLPDNARQLIEYARSLPNGDLFRVWELGNEVNSLSFIAKMPQPLTPELYASDLRTFRVLLDEIHPQGRIASPGDYFYPQADIGGFTAALAPLASGVIDILNWHLYATQSARCGNSAITSPYPASLQNLFNEKAIALHRKNAQYVLAAANGLPVWMGESSSAQCGGQKGVSDTLADALWQADWFGLMAEEGTRLIVRQTLSGSDYGITDPGTYDPRPTLLTLAMFRRTVEKRMLKQSADRSVIKAHAWCAAGLKGDVTAVLINPTKEPVAVDISLAGQPIVSAKRTILGADGEIGATRAKLDGLPAGPDGLLPETPGLPVPVKNGSIVVVIKSYSVAFVVLSPSIPIPNCLQ